MDQAAHDGLDRGWAGLGVVDVAVLVLLGAVLEGRELGVGPGDRAGHGFNDIL